MLKPRRLQHERQRVATAAALALLLPLATLLAAPRALADDLAPPEEMVWRCRLHPAGPTALVCERAGAVVTTDPPASPVDDALAVRRALMAQPGGCVTWLVRTQPAQYEQAAWQIPLHVVPRGDARLQLLAEAVMCGAEPACRVELTVLPAQMATAR